MRTTDLNEVLVNDNQPRMKESARGSKQALLLVEDDAAVRMLLMRVLRLAGYEVLEARRGTEALELSDKYEGEIALMVTDVILPGMNGREVADLMATRRPEMSVLFVSGYTDDQPLREMLGEGVDFLSKPILPKTLIQKVSEILG